ncbi:hypothetical protein COU61_04005 [Candidatus Pacearchaeota archaeon CG10_big_fil_rev_8_21_14_0_10_35_13]|nr:MAG: hypothetical protein COU61_04005 [Candidatus Pacearchaeota archaeon CG10_big_fil_rev_8_21_14_0_10_35_13]
MASYDGSGVFVPLFFDGLITGEQAVEALREFSVRDGVIFERRDRPLHSGVRELTASINYGSSKNAGVVSKDSWKVASLGHGNYTDTQEGTRQPPLYIQYVNSSDRYHGRPSDGDLALCLRGDGAVPKQVLREELKAFLKATSDKFIPVIKELFC